MILSRNIHENPLHKRIIDRIQSLPLGASKVVYQGVVYLLTVEAFSDGKSIKVFARELSGADFVSFNYYKTATKNILLPCEMRDEKVIHFLENAVFITN